MPTPNKIFCALPIYGPVSPIFFKNWIILSTALGRLNPKPRLHVEEIGYIDVAENSLIDQALLCTCGHGYSTHRLACQQSHRDGAPCSDPDGSCREWLPPKKDAKPGKSGRLSQSRCKCKKWEGREHWDYLVGIEHDNIIPAEWFSRVQDEYDGAKHPIVGLIYFGKNSEDQRPIPGYFGTKGLAKGQLFRLDGNHLAAMGLGLGADAKRQGFYEVDVVGMGATAIHRDVFLNWQHDKLPWFQTMHVAPMGFMGQDVFFCKEAKRQGFKIEVDSTMTADHIGPWVSTAETYTRTQWYVREKAKV